MKRAFLLFLTFVSSLSLFSCQGKDDPLGIKILTDNQSIYDFFDKYAKRVLNDKGYYSTYVFSNGDLNKEVHDDNSVLGNLYQDVPSVLLSNKENNFKITSVFGLGYEKLGIFKGKANVDSLNDIADGSTFALPDDKVLLGRSLNLLQDQRLVTLKEGVGLDGTLDDIEDNPKNLKFKVFKKDSLYGRLDEFDYCVFLVSLSEQRKKEDEEAKKPLVYENTSSKLMTDYANKHSLVFATKAKDFADPRVLILKDVFQSSSFKSFIQFQYLDSFQYEFLDTKDLYKV